MSSYGSIGDCGSGSGSILPGGRPGYNSKGQSNNDNFYRYPALVTLLSVIDEDPNESDFEDLDECEIQRRQSFQHHELKSSWRLGLFLAVLSGIFFTASSIMIQYFKVPAMEIFLIRSVLQTITMGLVATASPYSRGTCETQNNTIPWRLKVWVCLQAVLSALRLYVSYAMLAYLPLGDAVTIMFVEPLFTLVFSFLFLRLSASLWRILLCFGLLLGMVFTVQPPFAFGRFQLANVTEEAALQEEEGNNYDSYYKGVLMAIGCSIMGALSNIMIKKCEKIRSTVLVFYSGACGIIVALISWIISSESKKMLLDFEDMKISDWALLGMISIIGILAIFAMTATLKMISPTTVAVLRALEIILAFVFQIIVMHQFPNVTCIFGAILVSMSMCGISLEEGIARPRNYMPVPGNSSQGLPTTRLVHIGPNLVTFRSN